MTGELTPRVLIAVRYADRSAMVGQLFEAASVLGVERHEIRTTSDGFNIPRPVAHYLFPSSIPQG